LGYAKNALKNTQNNIMKSCGQHWSGRSYTTFMRDIGLATATIENKLWTKINKIFPSDRYKVVMTGKALVFEKERNIYSTIY
jgi:hypothetical protein